MRRVAFSILFRLLSAAIAVMVAFAVCTTFLRVPGIGDYPPAALVTVACGIITVLSVLFAPARPSGGAAE